MDEELQQNELQQKDDTVSLDEVADALKDERTTSDEDTLLRAKIDLGSRAGAEVDSGKNDALAWGSRSDVGLIRDHNEDSYLCRPPLFAVSDGMGGHAAGEVASSIAIKTLTQEAPDTADSAALARAIELANQAVIAAPQEGKGTPGMGCTLTAIMVEHDKLACAHVGDSRLYVLHQGMLVRVTHDHSYVEELVDKGVITTDEAREHPQRSMIMRALGSDPDMSADNFTVGLEPGDRILLCSDGLSSMVSDASLEEICVSSVSPQECADALVSAALVAGGQDNVTVVVIDVLSDKKDVVLKRARRRNVSAAVVVSVCLVALLVLLSQALYNNSYYLAPSDNTIGIYQGWKAELFGMPMYHLVEKTDVPLDSLEKGSKQSIDDGVYVSSIDAAKSAISSIQQQSEQTKEAQENAQESSGSVPVDISPNQDPDANPNTDSENPDAAGDAGDATHNTTQPQGGETQ